MSYRGTTQFPQQELTSVRRLRESMESPIEKGGGHKPVAKLYKAHGKIHFKLGGKIFTIDGGNVILDPDMPAAGTTEGGPGSGPRKKSSFAKGMNPAAIRRREERQKSEKGGAGKSATTQHIVKFYNKRPGAMAGEVAKSLSKKFGISEDSALTRVSNFLDRRAAGPLDD